MIRIANSFRAARPVCDAPRPEPAQKLTAADRALLHMLVCLSVAVAAGTLVGTFIICAHLGDMRVAAIAGGAAFGAVLGSLMVLRVFAGR